MSQIVTPSKMKENPKQVDQVIRQVINLCNDMLELADYAENCRMVDDCGVFFGALRDSAYKIRRLAKNELVRCENSKPSSS